MISTVITDDEVLARLKLRELIQAESDVQLVGEASSARETVELVRATHPALLFLDIHMPEMDGFEAIRDLTNGGTSPMPRIIFTTAYDKYAVNAFELHAVDYLLKPYTRERFQEALVRAREALRETTDGEGTKSARKSSKLERLVFKSGGRIVFLPLDELHVVYAEQNYIRLATVDGTHMLRETMGSFEGRLDPRLFVRIHRSTIVNLRHVKEIRTDITPGEYSVVMLNGTKLPVSRGYRSRLTELVTA
jgi:two-component system LytT family response regulator